MAVAIGLKGIHRTGAAYKLQKSKLNNSGKVNKKKKAGGKKPKAIVGTPILLVNMSSNDNFCEQTGAKLPKYGIAWQHKGHLFKDHKAVEAYELKP